MTDSERIKHLADEGLTFEQIVYRYMTLYHNEFNSIRINNMIKELNNSFLEPKLEEKELATRVSAEKALYLKMYLEGDMYTTEEAARKHLPLHIGHAEEIIKQCTGKANREF